MKFHRRHSRWYERVILNSALLFAIGACVTVFLPGIERWGWAFWLTLDPVRINTVVGTFLSFIIAGVILYRILRYPGTSPLVYVIPTVTCVYFSLVVVLFFARLGYSRQFIIESYLLSVILCWGVYFVGRRYSRNKYALAPFGGYRELLDIKSNNVEWRVLEKPDLGSVRFDAVVADFRDPSLAREWERFLASCALSHIPVYYTKQIYESLTGRVKVEHLHENQLGSLIPSPFYTLIKRGADILLSLIAIPLLSPVMILTSILIKMESAGPILFLQNRVGQGNKDFCIYKFRSMCKDSEKKGAQFAVAEDMRVTKVGKVIRKLRIDELPQFFNVLKGDMSLIGPRPEQRYFVDQFEKEIPFYTYRHIVRPGISGWAQVMHGYAADVDDTKIKIEHDFYYIKHFSLWLDVLIVFKTIKTILTGFGAR